MKLDTHFCARAEDQLPQDRPHQAKNADLSRLREAVHFGTWTDTQVAVLAVMPNPATPMRSRRCAAKPLVFATDASKADGKVPVQDDLEINVANRALCWCKPARRLCRTEVIWEMSAEWRRLTWKNKLPEKCVS